MFRVACFLALAAASSVASAGNNIEVTIEGAAGESLYRHVGGEWRQTVDGFGSFDWLGEEAALFDIRPGGQPWFSTHLLPADLAKFRITVGQRDGGFQVFAYSDGRTVSLPVVEVPEPPAGVLLVVGLVAAAGCGCFAAGVKSLRGILNATSVDAHGADATGSICPVFDVGSFQRSGGIDELGERGVTA